MNLSDLAAMGARPWAYTLGLALPSDIDDAWLRGFAAGLAQDQAAYDITLAGGDTVSTAGPLTLSLTAMGLIEAGQSLQRSGAQDGDLVCVTGTIGDAALGLGVLQGKYEESSGFLEDRYRLPQPRCVVGQALTGLATAALDVSDGLVADVGHLARASGVELVINAPDVPLSPQAATIASDDPATLNTILTGGDDYELVFTIPEHHLSSLTERTPPTDVPITVIGHVLSGHNVLSGHGVTVLDRDGMPLDLGTGGYRHR